jgi:hypothetical protein
MSFHRPQDRHRDHKEQLQQQYHEAREKMSHADITTYPDGEEADGAGGKESEEERKARFEHDMAQRLGQIGQQVRREHDRGKAGS